MADNLVYHYCSESVFKEIIQKKTLRFSDITRSNDSAELRWITKHIEPAFTEELNKAKENALFKEVYQTIDLTKLFKEMNNAFFHEAIYGKDNFFWYFVSCLSLEGDMLSQWRGYADDGKGFSIGFNREIFEKYYTSGFNYLSIHSGKVEYDEQKHIVIVKDCMRKLFAGLLSAAEKSSICDDVICHAFFDCFQALIVKSVFIKNPFFHEEKEWRMGVGTFRKSCNSKYIYLVRNNVREKYRLNYRNKNGVNILYFDLKFTPDTIERIILGPKNKMDLSELDILLKDNGIKCKIDKSEGTYI